MRWVGVVALIGVVLVGYSANAAIRAIIASQPGQEAPPPPPIGYETEDHFPGAAYLYVADADAAPGIGTTGTTALPDMPIPATTDLPISDGTIRPAPPFSMRAASPTDRARALQCLTAAIYYEAANEPEAGQRAVAQVILNRVRHPAFPSTVCGVVYQGSERVTGCQFSYACDGSMARMPSRAGWARAMRVAGDMLSGQVQANVGMATHYHTYAVTPSWNRSLVMTAAIGAHFFHRWQGYWGTPAAFSKSYVGGEPWPGPHARPTIPDVYAPTLASAAAAVAGASPAQLSAPVAPALAPPTALAAIQPAYRESGMPRPAPGASDVASALLPQSQILDKWKDSGKPLR